MTQKYQQPSGFYDSAIATCNALFSGEDVIIHGIEEGHARNSVFNPIFHHTHTCGSSFSLFSNPLNALLGGKIHMDKCRFVQIDTENLKVMNSVRKTLPDFTIENLVLPPGQSTLVVTSVAFDPDIKLKGNKAFQDVAHLIEQEKEEIITFLTCFEKAGGAYIAPGKYDSEDQALEAMRKANQQLSYLDLFHNGTAVKNQKNPLIRKVEGNFRLSYPPKTIEPILRGELGPEQERDTQLPPR